MKMGRFLNWKVSTHMNWTLVELARRGNTKRNYESSDEESSDADFMQTAYRLATGSKSAKKGKRKDSKCKGQRAVQGSKASPPAAMVEIDHSSWYSKVTVGERVDSKQFST